MASVYNKNLLHISSDSPMNMLKTLVRLYKRFGVTVSINANATIPYLCFVKDTVTTWTAINHKSGSWCTADLTKVNNDLGVAV
jgi:hypothetical protein